MFTTAHHSCFGAMFFQKTALNEIQYFTLFNSLK